MVSAVSEYRCVASGHRRMQSAACRHSTLTCKRVPRPAGTASPMFTRGSIPRPTPTNLFFPLPYRKCGHASRSQDIHPQHQHSAEQRSPSLELGPIDLRFHRPGAIAGQPQPFASVQRHGWPRHAAVAADIRCAASGSPTSRVRMHPILRLPVRLCAQASSSRRFAPSSPPTSRAPSAEGREGSY